GHCLDPASHQHFANHDRQLTDESPLETSLPSVLLTIGGSSSVCGSPPAVPRDFAGAASSFKLIPPL
ncbi:hypothetical protein HAX54_023269, partial [Datura stramonium]|nr:hypothetical protein [Datura stramonium]